MTLRLERHTFESYVEEAVASLPKKFKKLLDNISVMVEDAPAPDVYKETGSPGRSLILGTYQGVPFKYRGPFYGNLPPDVIVTGYINPTGTILRGTPEDVKSEVSQLLKDMDPYPNFILSTG